MIQAPATNPALSPAFDRNRKISRIMVGAFTIGFWATLIGLIGYPLIGLQIFSYSSMVTTLQTSTVLNRAPLVIMAAVIVETVPSLFIFHHAKCVFAHFTKGEIFASGPISHMRSAGLWLIVSMLVATAVQFITEFAFWGTTNFHPRLSNFIFDVLNLHFSTLLVGIAVYVTAYVMAEAERIADDHAKII
jgi:hypothetical protein